MALAESLAFGCLELFLNAILHQSKGCCLEPHAAYTAEFRSSDCPYGANKSFSSGVGFRSAISFYTDEMTNRSSRRERRRKLGPPEEDQLDFISSYS